MDTDCENCNICGIKLKNENYSTCYKCFTKDKHQCSQCKRMTDKKYEKCFNCSAPYKCGDCGGGMLNNKYKICYNCNRKKNCDHCQGTRRMYLCDDVWGKCMFC